MRWLLHSHDGCCMKRSKDQRRDYRLKTLLRRADHLEKRIAESPLDLSYDNAELAALRWAVEELERKIENVKGKPQ